MEAVRQGKKEMDEMKSNKGEEAASGGLFDSALKILLRDAITNKGVRSPRGGRGGGKEETTTEKADDVLAFSRSVNAVDSILE
ncbi:hypothetical protein H6P81_009163 [Aristolochia fimbriata]|uniref:Uncharacterized protein n=1 Tax=Aristolochia fimbriata TaxID=158543 RepID=A0AAV7EK32_ARIFI|nr:hypothetical protein H6P81_009163 [Aristolochia fimbriata]